MVRLPSALPSGTVTFLFTDIEGSTKRWEQHPEAMRAALAQHDELLRAAIQNGGGHIFKTVGDAFCAVFVTAPAALGAALEAQRRVVTQDWGEAGALRVRMALHTGAAQERDADYFGLPLNRVARLLATGYGGQILLSTATQELVRDDLPEEVSLRDMGEHRLKDLVRPERIFQIVAGGLPTEFPPLKTLDTHYHNLPLQPTPLLGREAQVETALSLLHHEDVRLLTLTGPGGTGKTRLGLQIGVESLDDFQDGVFFVPLASLHEPALVAASIAQTLGIEEVGRQPLLKSLNEHLRAKKLLLLLDNFEQIVEAAPLVADLLSACPGLKVLVTSRIALRLRGEHELPTPPLTLPDRGRPLTARTVSQYAAVELFIQRAQAVKPDFAVTNQNAPAVAEICARLDGLPLAIELAASRSKLLSPMALLGRLENRLKLLTGGARDLPARQQTLRAAIAWSYDLLNEGEKALFGRLSVFVGGCTIEAVEAVCTEVGDLEIDILDGITSLANKSLLRQEDGVDGEPRFFMLETIREFAAEVLEVSGDKEDIQRRHANFYAEQAIASHASMQEIDAERKLLFAKQLEIENDNLMAAIVWAGAHKPELELKIIGFWHTAWHSPYVSELGEIAERALKDAVGASPELVSHVLGIAAEHAARRGDFASQKELAERRLLLLRERENAWYSESHLAWALHTLGINAENLGEHETAIAYFRESLALFRQLESPPGIGTTITLNVLGSVLADNNQREAARVCYEEALAVSRQVRDQDGVASSLSELANLARRQGDLKTARRLFDQVTQIEIEIKDTREHPWRLYQLASLEMLEGDYEAAGTRLKNALRAFQETGNEKTGALLCLLALGCLAGLTGCWQRMARLFGAEEAQRQQFLLSLGTDWQNCHEHSVEVGRAALGNQVFAACWADGGTMSWEQAVEYAAIEKTENGKADC